jgi:hypothetical protein
MDHSQWSLLKVLHPVKPSVAVLGKSCAYRKIHLSMVSCIYTERFDIIITQHIREALTVGLTLVTVSVPQDASFVRVRAQRKKSNVC